MPAKICSFDRQMPIKTVVSFSPELFSLPALVAKKEIIKFAVSNKKIRESRLISCEVRLKFMLIDFPFRVVMLNPRD